MTDTPEKAKEYKVVTLSHKKNEPEVKVEMRKVDKPIKGQDD